MEDQYEYNDPLPESPPFGAITLIVVGVICLAITFFQCCQ